MEFLFMAELPAIHFYDAGAKTSDLQDRLWAMYIALLPIALTVGVTVSINNRQNKISAQKNTIEMIERAEYNENLQDDFAVFKQIVDDDLWTSLINPNRGHSKEKRSALLRVLNHYELVAIGIDNGHFDEAIYRKWMESTFIRDWIRVQNFIQRNRWYTNDQGEWVYQLESFAYFNKYSHKWDSSGRVVLLNQRSAAPPSSPQSPGEVPVQDVN